MIELRSDTFTQPTHSGITTQDINRTLGIIGEIMKGE